MNPTYSQEEKNFANRSLDPWGETTPRPIMMNFLVMSEKRLSLTCLTFPATLNQLHFTLLFMFTSFRISVLHLIVFMEDACLLRHLHSDLDNVVYFASFSCFDRISVIVCEGPKIGIFHITNAHKTAQNATVSVRDKCKRKLFSLKLGVKAGPNDRSETAKSFLSNVSTHKSSKAYIKFT
jgi:hypothetical protein